MSNTSWSEDANSMIDNDKAILPRTSAMQRLVTLIAVVVPFLGLVVAIACAWGWGFTWAEAGLLIGMYLATGLGITVGYHRLFAHKSFETIRPIKFVLGVLGSMSVQGALDEWVATHRRHHQHSDDDGDPHSPHEFGGGIRGVIVGAWHAHVGWIFNSTHPDLRRYVRDLRSDRLVRIVSRLFLLWVFLGLVIPTLLGGILNGTWSGMILGFLWGGLVRVFLVHHVTWSINSICHLWGSRPFRSKDHSRNNIVFGVLAFGEGWHNNHHAFPTSARHGLRWWEFDASYAIVRVLKSLGLAWNVRVPARHAVAAKRAEAAAPR